jgi:hypothetical protein
MANCTNCGQWAGLFSDRHDECPAGALPGTPAALAALAANPPTDIDRLIEKLTPVLMKAARSAGVAAALTFMGICIVAGFLYGLITVLFTSPVGR